MNKPVVSISFILEDGVEILLRNMDDMALCPYLTVSTEYWLCVCSLNVVCVCALLWLRDDLLVVSGE
jgi:hypothetical protein